MIRSARIGILCAAALSLAGCAELATVRAGVDVADTATAVAASELYASCDELRGHVETLGAIWTTPRGQRITGAARVALNDYCTPGRPPPTNLVSAARAVKSAVQAVRAVAPEKPA